MGYILIALWAAWFMYWVTVAHFAFKPRWATAVSPLNVLVPILICDGILVATPLFQDSVGSSWGVLLTAMGIGLAVWARHHLGRSWGGGLTIQRGHQLVRSGPYAITRHPIYWALTVAYLGTAIFIGGWALLAPPFAILAFIYKSRVEEKQLRLTFAEYRDYEQRVRF